MTTLSSCWHSRSLTFVPPQDHHQQQPTRTRPLTDNSGDYNLNHSRRFQLGSLSRPKMAKIFAVTFAVLFVMIVIGVVFCEEQATTGRSRSRTKALSLRKKKVSGGRLRNEEVVTTTTTLATPVEEVSEVSLPVSDHSNEEEISSTTTPRPPKSKKQSTRSHQTRPERQSTNVPAEGCGECDLASCRNQPESSCALGLVLDKCSCCMICGTGEGNRCYNSSIANLPITPELGICGSGLNCILRKDLDPNEPVEALCECRDPRLVCGSDNKTYQSECKLRESSHTSQGLSIAFWGPCVTAPWMPTAIENITVSEGEDASLSCEVKGFPSPVIHWEFLAYGSRGPPSILPGDDSNVVVTVRGGPEETMSTSWIQIIAVNDSRQGTYYCVATNANGSSRNAGTVLIGTASQQEYQSSRHLNTDDYIS